MAGFTIAEARRRFTREYMASKGWGTDKGALTTDQIMEIMAQHGWKYPIASIDIDIGDKPSYGVETTFDADGNIIGHEVKP